MTRQIAFDDRSRQQTHFTSCYRCACRSGITARLYHGDART